MRAVAQVQGAVRDPANVLSVIGDIPITLAQKRRGTPMGRNFVVAIKARSAADLVAKKRKISNIAKDILATKTRAEPYSVLGVP